MSIFIEYFDVLQVSPAARIVAWRFGPTNDDLSQVKVDVLRSYSPTEAFVKIRTVAYPQTYLRDSEVNLRDHWRGALYKLVVTLGGQTVLSTEAAGLRGTGISNPAREIIRQIDIDLSFSGSPAMVYLKRKGARCPLCWDPVLKKSTRSACPSCYATSYDGGYYQPVLTLVNFQPEVRTDQPDITRRQEAQTSAKMAGFPETRPGDLIYEVNMGTRWRISAISPSEMERTLTVQELTIVLLNPGDIEHKLPIPDGLDYVILPHHTRAKKSATDIAHDRDKDPIERVEIWR